MAHLIVISDFDDHNESVKGEVNHDDVSDISKETVDSDKSPLV